MLKDQIRGFEKYRQFLGNIPLSKYRDELKDIKWVEQDLVPSLYPLKSIYKNYWETQNFLNFENWFAEFWDEINSSQKQKLNDLKELVRAHRKFYEDKINGDLENKILLGFKARMYRTWVSVLTQLDFCYLFEFICTREGKNLRIECNADLDSKGIDARVNNIGFQIAKISQRKEALKIVRKSRVVTIPYAVFDVKEFQRLSLSPRVRDQSGYQKALSSFNKYFLQLNNGFVVFKEDYLKLIIDNITDIGKVKSVIENISLELAGKG
ncbi:TPA: TaqI family restriction endonuclease [bacterium]|nr:TaqI family restriction endonuclease [bacterium]